MSIPIHLRNIPGTPEIFDHPKFIASIAKWYKPNIFIEYGVAQGNATVVFAPFCRKVIGVDIKNSCVHDIPNMDFFEMDTRKFKTEVLDKMDNTVEMAFIDADHNAKSAFQDFEDLFPHIINNGIIFIHDTYPCEEKWTMPSACGDSWKVPFRIKEKYGSQCEILTIPIQPGLTMVKKVSAVPSYMV